MAVLTSDMNFEQIKKFFIDIGQAVVFWVTILKNEITKEIWEGFSADEALAIYEAAEFDSPLNEIAWKYFNEKDPGFAEAIKKFDEAENDSDAAVAHKDMMNQMDSFRKALATYERTIEESDQKTEALATALAMMTTLEDYNLALLLTDANPLTIYQEANKIINTLQGPL